MTFPLITRISADWISGSKTRKVDGQVARESVRMNANWGT
jgi:hypothetical protein